jgi:PAS domain S-box-containing protein
MAADDRRDVAAAAPSWGTAAMAMYRAAQAVAQPGGPGLFAHLVQELAAALPADCVFVAVFADDRRLELRTLAALLDGQPLREFSYAVLGTPCAKVVGHAFRYVASGVAAEFPPGTIFGAKGMDAYAAFPLNDSRGTPLGLVVAMDRRPIADAALCEALLKIVAGRVTAELERGQADDALRSAALAVSGARGEAVFAELVRLLTTILHVDAAFIASHEPTDPLRLHTLAMVWDQRLVPNVSYPIAGSPCETVIGQRFRAYPRGVGAAFPGETDLQAQGIEAYAGHPLLGRQGTPLGTIAVVSRKPLTVPLERVESLLQIFAVRAAAEIEQLRAHEAMRRSEASYRAIFEAAEDAIFIHDWDTGEVLDVNPKACETFGYSHDELCGVSVAEISSGVPPYTAETALQHIQLARLGRAQPFEWHRRNKDGSLHWDEVRLKAVQIDGRPHILAFTREVTAHKAALAALRAQEQKYRAIFDGTVDSMVLWDRDLRVVDVNGAFVQLTGLTREQVVGRHWSERPDADDLPQLLPLIEGALQGRVGEATLDVSRADGSRFDIELRYLPMRCGDEAYALGVGRNVSQRLDQERRLRASEEQYRAIFNASADALVLRDAGFRIIDVNATYERMSGWRRDEVLGSDRVIANPAEVAPAIRALHERALAGETIALEVPLVRRDGVRYELELRGTPIRHRGEPHVLYMGRDVTERKRTESALRDSEAQYREIFNASADALMLWNSRLQRVDVNPAHERIFGFAREEVVGRGFEGLPYPEEFVRPRLEMVRRALAGEPSRGELEALRKDGRRIVTELRAIPFTHRGEPHVLQIARDITDSRTADARLRASEEQYRAIFNASVDAMILWNSRFQRVDVNPAYERIYGWSRDEVVGRGYDEPHFSEEYARPRRELVQRALAGEACTAELEARRKDGQHILTEVHAIPFRHRGEQHVLAIARDITERREAEVQRGALERQLRQAQKMEAIGQLTGGIAHDFNNILTSVIGYLLLGLERAETLGDATLQRQLGQAHLASQRARELIAQMLAFARRQRGERRVMPLAPLVRQTLQLLRSTLPATVAVDDTALADDGSEGEGPAVAADAVQLEQVLFNLCINARDAISGTGLIRVRLRGSGGGWHCSSCRARADTDRWIELSVADSGKGMPAEVLERIFEPFYSTKEVGRGSGMGLAMVHGIVHDHGGHIVVETAPGAGSTFRVLLPPAAQDSTATPAPRATVAAPASDRLPDARVMVVDDEPMVGDFMAELLGGWGLRVVLQREPRQAADWLEDKANALDLLITDQTMPQMTGLALAQRAVAARPGLPVLLYTGNTAALDGDEARRHGVCAVLRKPVDAAALRAVLRRCLERQRVDTA